jgi:hypothetical protein
MLSKIWSCSATSRQKAYDPAHEARPRHVDDSVAAARGWILCDAAGSSDPDCVPVFETVAHFQELPRD